MGPLRVLENGSVPSGAGAYGGGTPGSQFQGAAALHMIIEIQKVSHVSRKHAQTVAHQNYLSSSPSLQLYRQTLLVPGPQQVHFSAFPSCPPNSQSRAFGAMVSHDPLWPRRASLRPASPATPHIRSAVAKIIKIGREKSRQHFGRDPDQLIIPYTKEQTDWLSQNVDDWIISLASFQGALCALHSLAQFWGSFLSTYHLFPSVSTQRCSLSRKQQFPCALNWAIIHENNKPQPGFEWNGSD
ncbi:Endogenous retrovirus group K member 10 Pol protein [Manis javanica]|nr:Endogenous retrovirus group K member 10 Pol protein [Manis javanica]